MDLKNTHNLIRVLIPLALFLAFVVVTPALYKKVSFSPQSLFAQTGGGTTYYACDCGSGAAGGCAAGNDNNAGTSSSAPLRTYDKLQDKMAGSACGTQFLFCQGGSFSAAGVTSWAWSGTTDCSSNPKIVGSYNAGFSSAKPQIHKTGVGHVFDIGSTPSQNGITFRDMNLICDDAFETGCNRDGVGVFLAAASRAVMDNLTIDNFGIGLQTANYTPSPPSYILRNSTIKNSQQFGILGHVSNDTQVLDNTFDNNTLCRGSECGFNRTFYISPNGYNNFTFARNTVSNWGLDQDAGGACNSNAGHVRGGNNVLIEDNIFTAKTSPPPLSVCSGIRVYGFTDAETHACRDCIVRRNKFYNTVSSAISTGSWVGGMIENNVISAPSFGGSGLPKQGIVLEAKQPAGTATDADTTNVTVRNNSIYLEDGGANTFTGITFGAPEGSGYVFANNAIQLSGTGSTGRCFNMTSGAAGRITTMNNNICSVNSTSRYVSNAGAGQTLSAWRTATGLDSNSQEGLPGFTSPASPSYDLRLLSNALSLNTGHATLSPSEDISRAFRPQGSGYDVGAYEAGGGSPPPPPPTQTCGNNVSEGTETCDGSALNGQSCSTQGFTGGTLSCNASCTAFVTSLCTNTTTPVCGNGVIEGTEQCDGTSLGGATCVSRGFTGGTLSCNACAFVTSACTNTSGGTITTLTLVPRIEGRSAVGQSITFTLRNETTNTQVGILTTTPNTSGQVVINNQTISPTQLYSLTASSTHFLRRVMRNLTLSSAPLTMTVLLAGDLNNDQIINSFDWSVMNTHWGTNNATSDINSDGTVNSLDFSYLGKNWMQVGE